MTDLTIKHVLQDWAKVEDVSTTIVQDKTETEHGRRPTLDSLRDLVLSEKPTHAAIGDDQGGKVVIAVSGVSAIRCDLLKSC